MRPAPLALLGWLAACASTANAPASSCPQRVVSLHDVTTEAVIALGAEACLVGVAEPVDLDPAMRARIAHVPRVEGMESVLATRPTHVFALETVREHVPELFKELTRRGVPNLAPRLERVADVVKLLRELSRLLERQAASETWLAQLQRAQRSPQRQANARVRVFVFDCCAPPFTAGQRALVTDLLERAGAQNVFADVDDDWFHASWEAAVARAPEVVVIDDYGGADNLANKRRALAEIAQLARLPVVVLPLRDALGTIRSAEVIERLERALPRPRG